MNEIIVKSQQELDNIPVPLEECGLLGRILAKNLKED